MEGWKEEKLLLITDLSNEKRAHQQTLQLLEEERQATSSYAELVEQAQAQIQQLLREKNDGAALGGGGSDAGSGSGGVHADTYRSLVEQKQHARIEELLKEKQEAESVASQASALAEQYSEEMEKMEEKNASYLKLIARMKEEHSHEQGSEEVKELLAQRERESDLLRQRSSKQDEVIELLKRSLEQSQKKEQLQDSQIAELLSVVEAQKAYVTGLEQVHERVDAANTRSDGLTARVEELQAANETLRGRLEEEAAKVRAPPMDDELQSANATLRQRLEADAAHLEEVEKAHATQLEELQAANATLRQRLDAYAARLEESEKAHATQLEELQSANAQRLQELQSETSDDRRVARLEQEAERARKDTSAAILRLEELRGDLKRKDQEIVQLNSNITELTAQLATAATKDSPSQRHYVEGLEAARKEVAEKRALLERLQKRDEIFSAQVRQLLGVDAPDGDPMQLLLAHAVSLDKQHASLKDTMQHQAKVIEAMEEKERMRVTQISRLDGLQAHSNDAFEQLMSHAAELRLRLEKSATRLEEERVEAFNVEMALKRQIGELQDQISGLRDKTVLRHTQEALEKAKSDVDAAQEAMRIQKRVIASLEEKDKLRVLRAEEAETRLAETQSLLAEQHRLVEAAANAQSGYEELAEEKNALVREKSALRLQLSAANQEHHATSVRLSAVQSEHAQVVARFQAVVHELERVKKKLKRSKRDPADARRVRQLTAELETERRRTETLKRQLDRERLHSELSTIEVLEEQLSDLKSVLDGGAPSVSFTPQRSQHIRRFLNNESAATSLSSVHWSAAKQSQRAKLVEGIAADTEALRKLKRRLQQ